MSSKNVGGLLIGLMVGFGLAGTPVDAAAVYTAAGACQWNEAESFDVTEDGHVVGNATSGTAHRVSCNLPTPGYTGTDSNDDLLVYYNDGNNGSNMEDHVYCGVYVCNLTNTDCNIEGTRFSCSSYGGCSSPTSPTFTGEGELLFTDLDRVNLYTTNVWCDIPNVDSSVVSEVQKFYYLY